MQQVEPTVWDQVWLPRYPLASDDLAGGVWRMSRPEALEVRYIEVNPHAVSNLLVVDMDRPDAVLRALSAPGDHPMPNCIVENPRNGHAHAVWALADPFPRTEYAHRKPIAYAAAITEGLRRALDGDQGYSGLLTKNPLHPCWDAAWMTSHRYRLAELDELLGEHMPPPGWQRTRRKHPVGLGRNCALFESARTWAYREVRHHWGDPQGLRAAIHAHAAELNAQFPEPLPASELQGIAESIWRWITTRSRMWADGPAVYEATFIAIQSARARKGARKPRPARSALTEAKLAMLDA